jgi:hypothetical protein
MPCIILSAKWTFISAGYSVYLYNSYLYFNVFNLPCVNQVHNTQITNKMHSLYMMHFNHTFLTNMSTHHLHAGLKLTTLLPQASLRTDCTILTPNILSIFNVYLYYFN